MPALLVALCLTAGPWNLVGPGGGGWIQSVAYSPHDSQTLYMGCDVGGFYLSTDGGASWTIHNDGLLDLYVQMVVPHPLDPQVLHVATPSGVHRSDDGGLSWRPQREGFPPMERYAYSAPVGELLRDPVDPETLYAGLGRPRERSHGSGTIMVSHDGGESWARLNPAGSLPDDAIIVDLLPRPDGGFIVTTQRGAFASPDGTTWTQLAGGLPAAGTRYVTSPTADPATLYISVEATPGVVPYDGGVWRSDDGGATWARKTEGLVLHATEGNGEWYMTSQQGLLGTDIANPDRVYVAGAAWINAGVFASDDRGEHWTRLTQHDRARPGVNVDQGYLGWGPLPESWALHPSEPGRLIYGSSGAILETRDSGATWQQHHTIAGPEPGLWRTTGTEVTCLWTVAPHPTNADLWLLGYMDLANWRTTDGGTWVQRGMAGVDSAHDSTGAAYAWDPTVHDNVWASIGQWGANRAGFYHSQDAGASWNAVPGLPAVRANTLLVDPTSPPDARRLWVGLSSGELLYGPADGSDWQPTAGLEGTPITLVWAANTAWLLTAGRGDQPGGVWRRGADGAWQRTAAPFVWDAKGLAVAGNLLYVTAREGNAQGTFWPGGLFVSEDGGATWTQRWANHFAEGLAVDPADPRHVVVSGTDHPFHDHPLGAGLQESFDAGQTWTSAQGNLPNPNVRWIGYDAGGRLLVGTHGNGLWWRAAD